jgi:hypothetical protein
MLVGGAYKETQVGVLASESLTCFKRGNIWTQEIIQQETET